MPRNIDRYYVSCWAVSARLLQRLQWRRCGAAGAGACALASVYILRRCVGAAAHPEGKRGSMLADGAGLATPRGLFPFITIFHFIPFLFLSSRHAPITRTGVRGARARAAHARDVLTWRSATSWPMS